MNEDSEPVESNGAGPLSWRRVLAAFGTGAVLAVVAAVVLDRNGAADPPPTVASTPAELSRQPLAEFLDRWTTWRRLEVAFTETSTRRGSAGELSEAVTIAQRDGDRVVRAGDDISAQIDGRSIGCGPSDGDGPRCVDNGPYDFASDLADEVDEFTELATGAEPSYSVDRAGTGCTRLRLIRDDLRPAWGRETTFCFDSSGVLATETSVREELTVDIERVVVRFSVTDADLAVPDSVDRPAS